MFNRPGPRKFFLSKIFKINYSSLTNFIIFEGLVDALEWLVGYINDIPEMIPRNFPWENLKS
jgi:hypothetical protein